VVIRKIVFGERPMPEANSIGDTGMEVFLLFVALLLMAAGLWLSRRSRSRRYGFAHRQGFDSRDVAQQLNTVMAAPFQKQRLLSASEYQAFKIIERDVAMEQKGFRVFAQTCLGEVLKSPDADAYRSINSKRVDMLIVDQGGWPVLAVEYQGSGHYIGTAAARDAVKKEALRKAGVRYVEIFEGDSPEQIVLRVREQLGWSALLPAPARATIAL
jgi:hypothetical protein